MLPLAQVRSAMMYVDYSEDAERDGGVMSDIMAQVWDLVLDRHQHPHQAESARKAVALLEQGAVAATAGRPCEGRQPGDEFLQEQGSRSSPCVSHQL